MTTDTPAAIIRDLAALDSLGAAQFAGRLPELSRRARTMVKRWDALQTPAPGQRRGRCPMCGAADADDCRAYGPESEACYRYARIARENRRRTLRRLRPHMAEARLHAHDLLGRGRQARRTQQDGPGQQHGNHRLDHYRMRAGEAARGA